jgi:hypothetical protein
VNVTPAVNVVPIQLVALDDNNVADVVPILVPAQARKPSHLGHDNIFRRQHGRFTPKERDLAATAKSFLVVGIITEQKKLNHEIPLLVEQLPPAGARDRLE